MQPNENITETSAVHYELFMFIIGERQHSDFGSVLNERFMENVHCEHAITTIQYHDWFATKTQRNWTEIRWASVARLNTSIYYVCIRKV